MTVREARDPAPPAAGAAGRGAVRVLLAVAALAYALDLVSKVLIVANLDRPGDEVRLLGGALYLVQARNSGAAFSLGTGETIVLTVVSLLVVAVIVRASRRLRSLGWAVSLGLVLGGAVGNLTDRMFRAPSPGKGHVVDWISVFADDGHVWPIFNLADSAIVVGGVLAVLLSLRGIDFTGRSKQSAARPDADG